MPMTPSKRRRASERESEADSTDDDNGDDAGDGEAIDWQETEVAIGPTPQKNGRILGLFDALSPIKESTSQTSSMTATMIEQDDSAFAAPVPKGQSRRKSPMKTPSFLRRQVTVVMGENDDDDDSHAVGGVPSGRPRLLFPAPPKRGLSLLIQELRAMEDAEEDEGMQVLREMEAEFPPVDDEPSLPATRGEGADQQGKEEVDDRGQQTEKVKWKKKGLKRSHRRVIMRPTAAVKRTDLSGATQQHDETTNEAGEESDEYINSEDEAAADRAAEGLAPRTTFQTTASGKDDDDDVSRHGKGAGTAAKIDKPKKAGGISQNYKSLKLRNSGAKGGSRFGRSRFGGRR